MRRQIIKQPIGPINAAVARPAIMALVKKSSNMFSALNGYGDDGDGHDDVRHDHDYGHGDKAQEIR